MRYLIAILLIPFSLISCAGVSNQIKPSHSPVVKKYSLPAIIERMEYIPTGTTRKIPLKECIGSDCRNIGVVDANEAMVIYYLRIENYSERLVYEELGLVATANPDRSGQPIILTIALYQDGAMEIVGMEAPRR